MTSTHEIVGIDPRSGVRVGDPVGATPLDQLATLTAAMATAWRAEQAQRTFADGDLLEAAAAILEAHSDDLVALAMRETGLPEARLGGEMVRTTRQLRSFAEVARTGATLDPIIDLADPDATPPRPDQRRANVPLGPVAVFAASNFPFAFGVPGGDTAAAWAAGCPVIVKAHPAQPRTSLLVADLLAQAVAGVGAPAAWFAVVSGAGAEIGQALAQDPVVQAVAFTGSFAGGTALARAASQRPDPIPVYAEMGSANPLFVTPAAAATRGDSIAAGLTAVLTASGGQLCTKPGTVYLVDDGAGRGLVAALSSALTDSSPVPLLYDGLRTSFRTRLTQASEDPRARLLVPGRGADDQPGSWQRAALVEVRADSVQKADTLLEEIFGPAAVVVWCRDEQELLAIASDRAGSLTATVHAEPDESLAGELLRRVTGWSGRVVLNDYPTGVTVGWATVHGGPFPATTSPAHTSVGMTAVRRFLRPVGFQGVPDTLLPPALRDANPLGLTRLVDGTWSDRAITR